MVEEARRLRNEGLTHREIGERLGVSRSCIGFWLSGLYTPRSPRVPHPENALDLPHKWVALSQGVYSKVPADLFPRINEDMWYASQDSKTESFYAARAIRLRPGGPQRTLMLHNFIFELRGIVIPEGLSVDHKSRDTLDNTDGNLRLASTLAQNRNRRSSNVAGVQGVYAGKGKWKAGIVVAGKNLHLGTYATISEASDAATFARWMVDAESYGVTEPDVSDAVRDHVTRKLAS